MTSSDEGVFVISIDTELAWGLFDTVGVDAYRDAYAKTREVVDRLCLSLDRHEFPATWAIVAHLLRECDEECGSNRPSPMFDWIDDWYGSLPCRALDQNRLWYAPEILERINACSTRQEVGLHGDTHMILGADGCSLEAASVEVAAAIETLGEYGVTPTSFVFPRNRIGNLDALSEHGIEVYRGRDSRWYETRLPRPLRRGMRFTDEFAIRTPPVVVPKEKNGLVEIPGSQIFRPEGGVWRATPPRSQLRRAVKGLEVAAERGRIFHLWFHPFNLGRNPDELIHMLDAILERATELRDAGRLTFRTLSETADMYHAGAWNQ
jgi:peptidoglycan/xylan/chitin deacetylase (PgdA/CDA1 family)